MSRFLIIVFGSILLSFLSTERINAQNQHKQSSFGTSYSYVPEMKASGVGFSVLKHIGKRYSAGFSYDHYFRQEVIDNSVAFFARRYYQRAWMSTLFVRAEAVQWRSIHIYGKAGFLYHIQSSNGTVTTFNDVSPYQANTGWFHYDDYTFSMILGGGVEWMRYLRLFAEPNLLLIDPIQFTFSTGIRIPL